MLYIGIDNGVTGTVGAVGEGYYRFALTPVKKEQSYTKAKNIITRVDVNEFRRLIEDIIEEAGVQRQEVLVIMERPLINPTMFKASMSASRTLEAELGVIEMLGLGHRYCDSRDWQKVVLPKGTTGTSELKKASLDIASRLYPDYEKEYRKHKDADGLMIAHWGKEARL